MVFDDRVMKSRLPADVYYSLKKTIEKGRELDLSVANEVARAMKDWAIEKGATHFTHWFQPLTGITAEKHDSFISPAPDGSIPADTKGTLENVGDWLKINGAATYGEKFPTAPVYSANTLTAVSAEKDLKTFYLWNWVWPKNGELRIGGYMDKPKKISYLESGKEINFTFDGHRILLHGLPPSPPDKICGVTVLKMEFYAPPRHQIGRAHV